MNKPRQHRIYPPILARAREMRHPQTPAEAKLWARLRNRQLGGFKFRRQYAIDRFIIDFYCADGRLCIEVDGDSHAEPDQQEYDAVRTDWLNERGHTVIRFFNREVLGQFDAVLDAILNECQKLRNERRPSPRPSLQQGEGVRNAPLAYAHTKRKVFAYIVHNNRLLVFNHPHSPEAGIQVPAGTLQDGERPEDGVMREAVEETGLIHLTLVSFLGEVERDMSDFGLDETHYRYFYHLRYEGDPPDTWRHFENDPSDGSPTPIAFEFFWAELPDGIPELIAGHGDMLPALFEQIAQE